MSNRGLLCTGIAGTIVTAICCFTPVLVVVLGAVGLAAWLAWLDFVLLPLLLLFVAMTVAGLVRMRRRATSSD